VLLAYQCVLNPMHEVWKISDSATSSETYQKIEDSVKPISGTRCMKSGFNGGVRSVSINQSVS
jgi:hypothetical protein